MNRRFRLKKREVQEVLAKASVTLGDIDLTKFIKGMEAAKIGSQNRVFLGGGKPIFIEDNGEVFPTLLNKEVLEALPKLTVDMEAVPHICNGADLMAPGIVKIRGEFKAGATVVVVDQKHSKSIALVKTLYDSHELAEKRRGKVAKNIHYVGDKFWKELK